MRETDLSKEDKAKKKVDVLLAEYQACHKNRDHYDSSRWTMGSIFIATSLALFGVSFITEIRQQFWEVCIIASFSVLLTVIWYAYNQHIDPFVLESIKRLHKIELELGNMGFEVKLHRSVLDAADKHPLGSIRGAWITYLLLTTILGVWFFRLWLFVQQLSWKIFLVLYIFPYLLIAVYLLHMRKLSARNLKRELEEMQPNKRK